MRMLVAVAAVLVAFVAPAGGPHTFDSVTPGFHLVKPDAWRFASVEEAARNRATARLMDEELQRLVRERASAPLVVVMKHQEPYASLNPSFQVMLRPLPAPLAQASAKQILDAILPTLEKAFQDFKLEAPVREFELSGHAAAELSAPTASAMRKEPCFRRARG